MSKIKHGGYVFVTWAGDHAPRHVHVYKDGRLVVKWNLELRLPIGGHAERRVQRLIDELVRQGRL